MSDRPPVLGQQVSYAIRVIAARLNPLDAGPRALERAALAQQYSRVIMQILVSLAILATGIYLVLKANDEAQREVGSGLIGLVAGYWLR